MEFQEKFIAFIDVLGFKNLVQKAELGEGKSLAEIDSILKKLGCPDDVARIKAHGASTCPHSSCVRKDLDFQITQISDCAIVSTEVSPMGIVNLIKHCWGAVFSLLNEGLLCRGYITRGNIYHTPTQIIGSGYHKAYGMEANVSAFKMQADERGTPFVEIDPEVVSYIENDTDSCVTKMTSRMTKSDGNLTALFPVAALGHSFMIAGPFCGTFDPQKEKEANDNVRKHIIYLREKLMAYVDNENPSALNKTMHYVNALNEQLKRCDTTDEIIDALS